MAARRDRARRPGLCAAILSPSLGRGVAEGNRQLASQDETAPMQARLDRRHRQPEGRADLTVREALAIAQHDHRLIHGWELIEGVLDEAGHLFFCPALSPF